MREEFGQDDEVVADEEENAQLPTLNAQRSTPEPATWEAKTPKTIVDGATLLADLATVRRRGWAFDDEEDAINIRCIAAPVRDDRGKVVAAVSAVGTVLQMVDSRLDGLAAKVMKAADDVSAILSSRT